MTKQIIELGGNIFEATSDFKLKVDCPMYKASHYCMTRDRVSDLPFTLVRFNKEKRWLMITWVAHLNLYLIRKLKFIRYEETFDLKYEWKYRKELKQFYSRLKKTT